MSSKRIGNSQKNHNNKLGKYLLFHVNDYFPFCLTKIHSVCMSRGGKQKQLQSFCEYLNECRRQQYATSVWIERKSFVLDESIIYVCLCFSSQQYTRTTVAGEVRSLAYMQITSIYCSTLDHQIYFISFNRSRMNHRNEWVIFEIEVFHLPGKMCHE